MALIALNKCIIKPSEKDYEITEVHKYKDFKESDKISEPTKTITFVHEKSTKKKNIKVDLLGYPYQYKSTPEYDENCDCKDNRNHEMYNFEFVADSFYDQNIVDRTTKRLKHPLQLMVKYN